MIKNVLITGGNKGIGKAIKNKFESEGYNVFVLEKKIKEKKLLFSKFKNLDEVKRFAKKVHKKIDILINNAGISTEDNVCNFKLYKMLEIHRVNFVFSLVGSIIANSVLKNMINNNWGRIVNITSIFGEYARENRLSYITSKFLLNSFTKSLAVDFSKYNILSNSVAPGVTSTDLTNKMLKNSYTKRK